MNQNAGHFDRDGGYNTGANAYNNFNYINQKNMHLNQAEFSQLNGHYYNEMPMKNLSRAGGSGLSAWGLITIIMLIIIIGMGGYYGILCYPLICKQERNYDMMDAASTTASANTPTRSGDFEKSGNYSSRSTTPSVIITS